MILNFWDDAKTIKATLAGKNTYDDELRKSSVMFIDNTPENDWIYNKLAGLAINCNNERYWFDLLGFHQFTQKLRIIKAISFLLHGCGDKSNTFKSVSQVCRNVSNTLESVSQVCRNVSNALENLLHCCENVSGSFLLRIPQ